MNVATFFCRLFFTEKLEFSESLSDSTEVIAEEAVDTTDSRSSLDQHLTRFVKHPVW